MLVTRRQRSLLAAVTALAAVVAAGAIAAAASSGPDATTQPPTMRPALDLHNGLLVTGRTEFRVCVESSDTAGHAAIETGVRRGLAAVHSDPLWGKAYGQARYDESTAIDWGCPAPRLPAEYDRTAYAGPGVTATPGPYRIWVYALDDATARRLLGPRDGWRILTAESIRSGEASTFPVSTALLIRAAAVARPDAAPWLHAAGLR